MFLTEPLVSAQMCRHKPPEGSDQIQQTLSLLFITDDDDDDDGAGGRSPLRAFEGRLSAHPSSWTEPSEPETGTRPGPPDQNLEHPPGPAENISGRPSCGTAERNRRVCEENCMVLVSPTQLKHQRAGAERRRRATVSVIRAADTSRYASLAQWESLPSSLTAVCLTARRRRVTMMGAEFRHYLVLNESVVEVECGQTSLVRAAGPTEAG